jgi:hypothetical protein
MKSFAAWPVGTTDVHLVYGSPRKACEYLFEDQPAREVAAGLPPEYADKLLLAA